MSMAQALSHDGVMRAADGTPVAGLTLVDATSAAGCAAWDAAEADAYYFSPQKGLGADGGLWIAVILFEQPRALDQNLTIVSNLDLHALDGWAHGVGLDGTIFLNAYKHRCFR